MRQHSSSQPYCAPVIYRIHYCRYVEAELLRAIVQLRQDILVGSRTRVFTRPSSVFRTFMFAGRISTGPSTKVVYALLFFLGFLAIQSTRSYFLLSLFGRS